MPASASVRWSSPPAAMARRIAAAFDEAAALRSLADLAAEIAAELEAEAKADAPWEDRTGEARRGLVGRAETRDGAVAIYLVHTAEYGVHLELKPTGRGGRPIVIPVLERNYARVMAAVAKAVAG